MRLTTQSSFRLAAVHRGCRAALALGLLAISGAAFAATPDLPAHSSWASDLAEAEVLDFDWVLGGFKGTLARIVVPGRGGATLRTGRNASGHLVSELNIYSPRSRHGDFQRYGAEIGADDGRKTLRAWTTQMFRGRKRERAAELAGEMAVDIASSIWRLRHDPSFGSGRSRLWSSGNFYPIDIELAGKGRAVLDGRFVETRTYLIQGVREEGARFWKGRVELVVAGDERSTPLEIVLRQEGVKVRLALDRG